MLCSPVKTVDFSHVCGATSCVYFFLCFAQSVSTGQILVKLHMDHTRVLRVNSSTSFDGLLSSVCDKFQQDAGTLSLWYAACMYTFCLTGEFFLQFLIKFASSRWFLLFSAQLYLGSWVFSQGKCVLEIVVLEYVDKSLVECNRQASNSDMHLIPGNISPRVSFMNVLQCFCFQTRLWNPGRKYLIIYVIFFKLWSWLQGQKLWEKSKRSMSIELLVLNFNVSNGAPDVWWLCRQHTSLNCSIHGLHLSFCA